MEARPIYKKLLILAVVIYITGVTILLVDIYLQIGEMRHASVHVLPDKTHEHKD